MIFLGVKVVLPVFSAAKMILVLPGKILTLFLATIGWGFGVCKVCYSHNLAMWINVPKMFFLANCHMDILHHKLKL